LHIDSAVACLTALTQLSHVFFYHVPEQEVERKRIERTNPNPKQPLVRYVGGTWRTGGLLALSRAFGNAYLKGSLQVWEVWEVWEVWDGEIWRRPSRVVTTLTLGGSTACPSLPSPRLARALAPINLPSPSCPYSTGVLGPLTLPACSFSFTVDH
jgi:hypothetical protein